MTVKKTWGNENRYQNITGIIIAALKISQWMLEPLGKRQWRNRCLHSIEVLLPKRCLFIMEKVVILQYFYTLQASLQLGFMSSVTGQNGAVTQHLCANLSPKIHYLNLTTRRIEQIPNEAYSTSFLTNTLPKESGLLKTSQHGGTVTYGRKIKKMTTQGEVRPSAVLEQWTQWSPVRNFVRRLICKSEMLTRPKAMWGARVTSAKAL